MHTKVINPILLNKGIRSLMGAPLRSGGVVIGVLHVGTLSPRAFTSDDCDLLQLAADRAALAVQALNVQLDRATAAALQHTCCPPPSPRSGGWTWRTLRSRQRPRRRRLVRRVRSPVG